MKNITLEEIQEFVCFTNDCDEEVVLSASTTMVEMFKEEECCELPNVIEFEELLKLIKEQNDK